MRNMFPQKLFRSFAHAGVLAILALSSAWLAGCASSNNTAARSLSELPDTYTAVFLAPVEVNYSGSASLNAGILAQNTGIGLASALSSKGYTVLITDSAVSENFITDALARLRSGVKSDAALLGKLQKAQNRKHYAVLKGGEVADVLLDITEFRSGLKTGSYVDAIGKIQVIEPPALSAQQEESRQFGKSVVFNVDIKGGEVSGLNRTWTSRGGHGEIKSIGSVETLTAAQTADFALQVLKELPEIQTAQSPAKP
jgi:hypothetical protein